MNRIVSMSNSFIQRDWPETRPASNATGVYQLAARWPLFPS